MKRIAVLILALGAWTFCHAQSEIVAGDPLLAAGLDRPYPFGKTVYSPVPKGYEAFYISHYGRHGSRYPYSSRTLTILGDMLREAGKCDGLTEFGKELLPRMEEFRSDSEHRIGELTELGWEQQKKLAGRMVASFPDAFRKGSSVFARASSSTRAIVSMSSFCIELGKLRPGTEIYCSQGFSATQVTAPNMGDNPLRLKGPGLANPYTETPGEYFTRHCPQWRDILGVIFKDPDAVMHGRDPLDVLDHIYMLVVGMNSLPVEARIDLDGIFTPQTLAILWEADNYMRFCEYIRYSASCCSIINDIIGKADERIAAGSRGADLRFGHDHVLMTLMMIADIDGFAEFPENPDSLGYVFQTFRSPMAGNLQFVFFRPKSGRGEVLVRPLLNSREVVLNGLGKRKDSLYSWTELKEWLRARVEELTD